MIGGSAYEQIHKLALMLDIVLRNYFSNVKCFPKIKPTSTREGTGIIKSESYERWYDGVMVRQVLELK